MNMHKTDRKPIRIWIPEDSAGHLFRYACDTQLEALDRPGAVDAVEFVEVMPTTSQETAKDSITMTQYSRALEVLVGQRVKINWVDPNDDWPYFILLEVSLEFSRLKLKGADYPDGSASHTGNVFWANWCEIGSILGI